jgi:hypothetical protein
MTGHDHRLITSSRIEHAPVFDPAGREIGRIADVLIEKATGQALYALVTFGGLLGVGKRFYPVPWSALTYTSEWHGYVVPLDEADLDRAPWLAERHVVDDIDWRETAHSRYGVAPYWLGAPVTF